MDLKGRSALVTGGAGGLGAATVRHLVELGMGVAIFDRDGKRAAALAAELGSDARGVEGDVTDDDDVAAAVEAARSLGAFSLVANVAGGATGGGRIVGRDGKLPRQGRLRLHDGDERRRHLQRQPASRRRRWRRTTRTSTASAA